MIFAIIFSMAMVIIITDYTSKECNCDDLPEDVYYNYHNTTKTPAITPCPSPKSIKNE